MKTLIELENNNLYTRTFSGFHFHFLAFLTILVSISKHDSDFRLTSDDIWLCILLVFVLSFNINQFKIYIIKIVLNEDVIIIDYYSWFKFKTLILPRLSINVEFKDHFLFSHKLEFYLDGKKIITQYGKFKLSFSEWNDDILSSTFKELSEFIKDNH